MLGQITRARDAIASAARVYFWRDAHGGEVDFAVEHDGRVRLVEAKWAEDVDARAFAPGEKVRAVLGRRAAAEHWIACRTPQPHPVSGLDGVVALNGARFTEWIPPSG